MIHVDKIGIIIIIEIIETKIDQKNMKILIL
jgi:hypothetical protein